MDVVFPCYANWETFVVDTKCLWTKSETFFCVRHKCCACGQTGKYLCWQQCVLVCQGLKNRRGSKTKKQLRWGNIGSKSTEFVVGSDSSVTYTHSLRQIAYSQSSPRDHSRKRPALVTTTVVKSCLNCHSNSVIKSSRKRPFPWETATTFGDYQLVFSFVFELS